jgi:hypothetical protein
MGYVLKRVPPDFDWPLNEPWRGYINPLYTAQDCAVCGGDGYSATARRLRNLWYGYESFRPKDRGSVPFTSDDDSIAFTRSRLQSQQNPEYFGLDHASIRRNALRLCKLWNAQWCHHLNENDVAALIEKGRLYDFTHTFTPEKGWQPKIPAVIPTPRQVNERSVMGFGHDSINSGIVIAAECERLGASCYCSSCEGNGKIWPSPEAKSAYEAWKPTPPPAGDAYQIWQTVSEGSPISPPFATPEELARYMSDVRRGGDAGTSYGIWLAFINGPGWAPSAIINASARAVAGIVEIS